MNSELLKVFDLSIRNMFQNLSRGDLTRIEEIRLRTNQPLICIVHGNELALNQRGVCKVEEAHIVTLQEVKNTLKLMSNFSLFSIEEQVKKGFFTINGGHRVGVCGKTVIVNGEIATIKDISSLNVRISRQILGCSDNYIRYVVDKGVKNTLIVSAPNNGKTTFLRDLVRNVSNQGYGCVVVDERSEIGGTYKGELQCDLGRRTDVLDSCDKVLGLNMALRSMAPKAIVVDEVGTDEDIKALIKVFNSGVNIIATCHAENIEQFKQKKIFKSFVEEKLFDRYIFIKDKKPIGIYGSELDENINLLDTYRK